MVSKKTLLETLEKYRFLQKLVDEEEQKNYVREIESTASGTKFLDGKGNVICEILLTGYGAAGVATDEEVNEMFDEIFGVK